MNSMKQLELFWRNVVLMKSVIWTDEKRLTVFFGNKGKRIIKKEREGSHRQPSQLLFSTFHFQLSTCLMPPSAAPDFLRIRYENELTLRVMNWCFASWFLVSCTATLCSMNWIACVLNARWRNSWRSQFMSFSSIHVALGWTPCCAADNIFSMKCHISRWSLPSLREWQHI